MIENNHKFFENKSCEYYPCHDMEQINCMFCFCPLYLIHDCPGIKAGVAEYIDEKTKDCSRCTITHHPTKSWEIVVRVLSNEVYNKEHKEDWERKS